MERENIFAKTFDKVLISKIYKELIKLNTKETPQTIHLKNEQRTITDTSPKRMYGCSIDI